LKYLDDNIVNLERQQYWI